MSDNKLVPPSGEGIVLRMLVNPRPKIDNPKKMPNLDEKKLKTDSNVTGDRQFIPREAKMTIWLMSSLKKSYALKLYDEVYQFNPLPGYQDLS